MTRSKKMATKKFATSLPARVREHGYSFLQQQCAATTFQVNNLLQNASNPSKVTSTQTGHACVTPQTTIEVPLDSVEWMTASDKVTSTGTGLTHDEVHHNENVTTCYPCLKCNIDYKHRQSLCKHIRKMHPKEATTRKPTILCLECKTSKVFTVQQLVQHANLEHGKQMSIKSHELDSMQEFAAWKLQLEKQHPLVFIPKKGKEDSETHTIYRYQCSRSGNVKCVSEHKRVRRSNGSCKINGTCTAFMIVKHCKATGKVSITYCVHHIGHDIKLRLRHLKISDNLRRRRTAVSTLTAGAPEHVVVDQFRDGSTEVSKDTFCTQNGLANDVVNAQHKCFRIMETCLNTVPQYISKISSKSALNNISEQIQSVSELCKASVCHEDDKEVPSTTKQKFNSNANFTKQECFVITKKKRVEKTQYVSNNSSIANPTEKFGKIVGASKNNSSEKKTIFILSVRKKTG